MSKDGIVFDIQRFCVHDGPGIRTTVFLKGCNMRCKWCHNPESFRVEPELMYYADKCTACGGCKVCPQDVHQFDRNGVHKILRESCTACGLCAEVCLQKALEVFGKRMTVEEVMETIRKDEKYYRSSCGGVTFSGGEATVQFLFLLELLAACRQEGYHVALETNGLVNREQLEQLIPMVDLFLFDYKLTDAGDHRRWTAVANEPILENLAFINQKKVETLLRCPIIPTVNDNAAHFAAIKQMQQRYPCITQVEIMPYHDIGKSKWNAIDMEYALHGIETVTGKQKKKWEELIGI